MVYTLRFFPFQNAVCFIILTYLVPVLFTFYIQDVLKLKKNNSGAKRLSDVHVLGRSAALQAPGLWPAGAAHKNVFHPVRALRHFALCLSNQLPVPFQPDQVVAGFPYKFDRVAVLV